MVTCLWRSVTDVEQSMSDNMQWQLLDWKKQEEYVKGNVSEDIAGMSSSLW